MRALLPTSADAVDVHEFYATRWLPDGGLRVNFVASVDGAAQADGTSAGLQTPGDNRIFAALRDLADVVLAGAGTVVAEGYRPISVSARRAAVRREYGLADTLPTAVISRMLRLDPGAALFADVGGPPTIVLTCAAAPAQQSAVLARTADVVVCGDEQVEPGLARRALEERGLGRILSEGGPRTFAELAAGGVVDELCLTVSPMLTGPGPTRITEGPRWAAPAGLVLTGLLEEDGALFARYAVDRPVDRPVDRAEAPA